MRVSNLTSPRSGNPVANQFRVSDDNGNHYFQSYNSTIIKHMKSGKTYVDPLFDYSVTTRKYLNVYLGHNIQETRNRIKSGEYKMKDLNKGKRSW